MEEEFEELKNLIMQTDEKFRNLAKKFAKKIEHSENGGIEFHKMAMDYVSKLDGFDRKSAAGYVFPFSQTVWECVNSKNPQHKTG